MDAIYYVKGTSKTLIASTAAESAADTMIDHELNIALNDPGNMEFSIPMTNENMQNVLYLNGEITFERNGDEIFRGELKGNTEDMLRTGTYTVRGALAYLSDTMMTPYDFSGSVAEYMGLLLDDYNSRASEWRQIQPGNCTVEDPNDYIVRSDSNYVSHLALMQEKLIDRLGGYLWLRVENGVKYLDYLSAIDLPADQTVEYGQNIMDIEQGVEYGDVYTVLIPEGKEDEETGEPLSVKSVNNGSPYVVNEAAVQKYGRREAVISFPDVTLPENLLSKTQEELDTYANPIKTIRVKAIDMAMWTDTPCFRLGQSIHTKSPYHDLDDTFVLSKMKILALKPEEEILELGDLRKTYTQAVSKKITKAGSTADEAKQQVAEVKKALYIHNCRGTSGQTGYVKFAQITISSSWQNVPIILHVLQRNRTENILSIWYENQDTSDPDLKDFFHYGGQELYLEHAGVGVWNLYAKKTEAYDNICVTQAYKADYMRYVNIDWLDEHYDEIPDCVISRATIPGTELLVSTAVIQEMITAADAGRVLAIKAGTYDPINIEDTNRFTILIGGLVKCSGDFLLSAVNCKDLRIFGGNISGNGMAQLGIKLENCLRPTISHVTLSDIGTAEQEDTAAIRMLGDCSGFSVERCYVSGVNAGVVSSDGYIHAYGIQVNRLGSSNAYSRTGNISDCSIENVAGTDSADTKADGDGIFINNPPYLDDSGNVNWRDDINITINNCTVNNCKKRGIKLSSVGVKVRNTYVDGEMWYAGIDCQYGHADIEGCTVINTSDYNDSATSAIITSEGGVNIRRSTIKAPYGEYTYHPGVRFNKRLPGSVIPDTVPWEDIYIDDCYLDKVSRAVYGHVSGDSAPVPAKGVRIRNCRIGDFSQARPVEINTTMFSSIEAFEFTDFRFDYGSNRAEVKEKNADFVYPISISTLNPTISFDLHSRHWTNEPMSGYDGLPTSPHARIVYAGSGMGNIYYKEYTGHGSRLYGNRAPDTITSTLSKQLLYNSKVGDMYTDTTAGKVYICTAAGTSDNIGTWTLLGG